MGVKNPQTYGDYWWAQQVDANKVFADDEEASLAPHLQGLLGLVGDLDGFPPAILSFLSAIGTSGNFGLAEVGKQTLSSVASGGLTSGLTPFLRSLGYAANAKFPSALIDFQTATLLAQRRKITAELFKSRAEAEGFKEDEGALIYQANLAFPDIQDLIRWARYASDGTDTFSKLQERLDIPDTEFHIWDWITAQLLSVSDIQSLYRRNYMNEDQAILELRRLGWAEQDAFAMLDLAYSPAPTSARVQSGLLEGLSRANIEERIISTGIHPDQASEYYNAVLAKPNPQDIIRWRLRTDPSLAELPSDLSKIGVHPDYQDVYKTLAYPVPPIGDMITMAVREAFTPEIAERFGQYEDYPTELTKFAAMNGISEDWSKRYWAAHWSLPSPQQGFQMLHRGIINKDELHVLMRALDIMPFWRDKLIQVAYKPLTRVDVRRMFALGVLTEDEVKTAYLDVGYSEKNSERLTEFTVKQVLAQQTGFNTTDVVAAYKNSQLNRSDAYTMIADLGVKGGNITSILNAAETQRDWSLLNDQIRGIGNEYKQEVLDGDEAEDRLRSLGLPSDKVEALKRQWYKETVERPSTPWTKAEIMQFVKRGIIDDNRAKQELGILGFDKEHIGAIMANANYVKPG